MNNDTTMTAAMMSQKVTNNDVAYYINRDISVVTMDLKKYSNDTQFEFMAIMPRNENLNNYIKNVTKEQIDQIDEKLILASEEEYGVKVYIPKFKFNYELKLKDGLMKLGIKDAFDKYEADLSKIADPKPYYDNIYVKDALHKADIEFTEKGVKAAAVTLNPMVVITSGPKLSMPAEVVIDRSFMFIIRDKNTKDIWFTGTVYEPNKWGKKIRCYFNNE